MASTLRASAVSEQRVIPDVKARMAKVVASEVRKADDDPWKQRLGRLVEALRRAHGWTLDEFAGKLIDPETGRSKDPRQVARWERGEERPHFDVILAIEELHQPLILAFVDLLQHCVESETTIRIRRRA